MKITKEHLKALNVCNPDLLCQLGKGRVYINYRPSGGGRSMIYPAWQVIGIGFGTDPGTHFLNYGNKTFFCGRADKEKKLVEAKQWACEKFGIGEWVKDPFGGWQDAQVYAAVAEKCPSRVNTGPEARLKVWGGLGRLPDHPFATPYHGQIRLIVSAKSRAAASRALVAAGFSHLTDSTLRDYWSETGNENELKTTAGTENVVFANSAMIHGPYQAVRLGNKAFSRS